VTSFSAADRRDFTFTSSDGLSLFARDWAPRDSTLTPLLCLPGLTRNSRDFEPLAASLTGARRIIALDYRGRGRSQYAADWTTYNPRNELADAIALLDYLQIPRVCVIGTSRGGIIAMLMGLLHGPRLAGAVLNDIGPELEATGLLRIARQIARPLEFRSWPEAVSGLKALNPGLDNLGQEEWELFARRVFKTEGERIVGDYDPNIMRTFPTAEDILQNRVPQLWEVFAELKDRPCAVLRGEHSDLLSMATTTRMAAAHPGLLVVTVKGRGHVPFLDEPECVAAVKTIAAACDP
jgi:pimeloyl-ACP methyl ester carboxylesterase